MQKHRTEETLICPSCAAYQEGVRPTDHSACCHACGARLVVRTRPPLWVWVLVGLVIMGAAAMAVQWLA